MARTDTVVASSRYVRMAMTTCLAAVVPLVLGFQLFTTHLGQTSRDVLDAGECGGDGCVPSPAVVRTVTALESRGLECRTKPGLTDEIVFEWNDDQVDVIDFASALRASSNSEGWVRRYCMTPR